MKTFPLFDLEISSFRNFKERLKLIRSYMYAIPYDYTHKSLTLCADAVFPTNVPVI